MTSKQEPRTNGPKLKPCPFCGGDAYFDRLGTPRVSAIVACGDCGCRMESSDEGENSGRTWNQREPAHPPEATGLQCEKDGVCALVSRNDDEWHCTACNGDFVRKQPVEPAPVEATGLQPVRRWNAKYPGISMLEHNGELIRSGFGPYVLAEDYDRVASLLSEAVRMIEGYRRAGFITNPAALEQASDFALRAGNSHHE